MKSLLNGKKHTNNEIREMNEGLNRFRFKKYLEVMGAFKIYIYILFIKSIKNMSKRENFI